MTRRPHCIRWDDYFMGTAMLAGRRQKDSHSNVGILYYLQILTMSPQYDSFKWVPVSLALTGRL